MQEEKSNARKEKEVCGREYSRNCVYHYLIVREEVCRMKNDLSADIKSCEMEYAQLRAMRIKTAMCMMQAFPRNW
mgnify:FL=1